MTCGGGPTSSGSNKFAIDSPLEGTGFEPSVPLAEWEARGVGASISKGAFAEPCAFKPRAW